MGKDNKLLKGLLIGAMMGGMLSLLDKKTRQQVISKGKSAAEKIKNYKENPSELTDRVKEKMNLAKKSAAQIKDDLEFITEKIKELQETTPQVLEIVKEAKEKWKQRQ